MRLPSPAEIVALETKVNTHLALSVHDTRATTCIPESLSCLKRIATRVRATKDEQLYSRFFAERFKLINSLAQAFKDFESNATKAYEDLRVYLATVNAFLKDSRKQVDFDVSSNALYYSFLGEDGKPVGNKSRLESMSSGERQILILLTFLKFVAEPERVFIIDEPELSLHPKWQQEFVGALHALQPSGTQLLLATHSPEIVGPQ